MPEPGHLLAHYHNPLVNGEGVLAVGSCLGWHREECVFMCVGCSWCDRYV